MRLLKINDHGKIDLTRDLIDQIPAYAILSHTWAEDDSKEVTFEEVQTIKGQQKEGYRKIQFCVEQAKEDGIEYCWVDTCCINKANYSELSEAITSMFHWYKQAEKCYVYLSDVSTRKGGHGDEVLHVWEQSFRISRWFTRGWTLQELLAPSEVIFFSREGTYLGTRYELQGLLHEITGIPSAALRGQRLSSFSVDERMRWTQGRSTKKREDQAYCLLGIFGVFMPLIYGEGDHAYVRLLNELNKEPKVTLSLKTAKGAEFDAYGQTHQACHPATRIDLLQTIRIWAHDESGRSIFWLSGLAGTGKSTISWTTAKWLADLGSGGPMLLGASFFFKRGEGDRASAAALFPTLASQLAVRISHFDVFLAEAVKRHPQICNKALAEQFKRLICEPLQRLPTNRDPSTYIVVLDALDECDNETDIRHILELWSTLPISSSARLRLFLTSRPELVIRLGFKKMSTAYHQDVVMHEVPLPVIEHDIHTFLTDALGKVRNEYNLEPVGDALPNGWPGETIIDQLTRIAVPLFIVAATIYRFIGNAGQPQDGLDLILHPNQKVHLTELGGVYKTVLSTMIPLSYDKVLKDRAYQNFQIIVGAIVCLAEPLSRNALADLLNMAASDIQLCLRPLHALLHVPPDQDSYIRPLHLSLGEYLMSPAARNEMFVINATLTHHMIWQLCLRLLSGHSGLREDICCLKHPGCLRQDIPLTLINREISPAIQYACRYWVHHVQTSGSKLVDGDEIHMFLQRHLLHWLEVLSLMDCVADAINLVNILKQLAQPNQSQQVALFLEDARRFILANRFVIELAPLQLYSSALVFAPQESLVRCRCGPPVAWIQRTPNTPLTWGPELQKLEGHTNWIVSIAFSVDDLLLASASHDATIRLWNPHTGQEIQKLEGHTESVRSVAFSSNNSILASASNDGTIRLWNPYTAQEIRRLNVSTCTVAEIVFSHDGSLLASATSDNMIRLWDPSTGQEKMILAGHSRPVSTLAFSTDDTLLASGCGDYTVRLWNPSTGEELEVFDKCLYSTGLAFSHNGCMLAMPSQIGSICFWDLRSHLEIGELGGSVIGFFTTLAFSPNDSILASGYEDGTVRLWNPGTAQEIRRLDGHIYNISKITFSHTGSLLASASWDCTIRFWDCFISQKSPKVTMDSNTTRVDYSADGLKLASRSHDGTIYLWNPSTGKALQKLQECTSHNFEIVFSSDGSLLASVASMTIQLWNLSMVQGTKEAPQPQMSKRYSLAVFAFAISHNGLMFALALRDNTVQLWNLSNDKEIWGRKLDRQVDAIAFSYDDSLLALASAPSLCDKRLELWDVSSSQRVRRTELPCQVKMDIHSMALSADNSLLVSASYIFPNHRTIVHLWRLSTGEAIRSISLPRAIRNISLTAEEDKLLTNRGVLKFSAINSAGFDLESGGRRALFLQDDWLTCDGERILWIPQGYREVAAVHEDMVAFGGIPGNVGLMQINFDLIRAIIRGKGNEPIASTGSRNSYYTDPIVSMSSFSTAQATRIPEEANIRL